MYTEHTQDGAERCQASVNGNFYHSEWTLWELPEDLKKEEKEKKMPQNSAPTRQPPGCGGAFPSSFTATQDSTGVHPVTSTVHLRLAGPGRIHLQAPRDRDAPDTHQVLWKYLQNRQKTK